MLSSIQSHLEIDDLAMAQLTLLDLREFRRRRSLGLDLNLLSIISLARFFNVDEFQLQRGQFDLEVLLQQATGDDYCTKERYLSEQNTCAISLKNTLCFVRKYNPELENSVYRYLQLTPEALNKMNWLSTFLVKDAHSFLKDHYTTQDRKNLGLLNADYLIDQVFPTQASRNINLHELYETMFHCSNKVEMNWQYKITKFNRRKMVVQATPTERALAASMNEQNSSNEVLEFRVGCMEGISRANGQDKVPITVTRSIYQDDPFCEFHFDLSHVSITEKPQPGA